MIHDKKDIISLKCYYQILHHNILRSSESCIVFRFSRRRGWSLACLEEEEASFVTQEMITHYSLSCDITWSLLTSLSCFLIIIIRVSYLFLLLLFPHPMFLVFLLFFLSFLLHDRYSIPGLLCLSWRNFSCSSCISREMMWFMLSNNLRGKSLFTESVSCAPFVVVLSDMRERIGKSDQNYLTFIMKRFVSWPAFSFVFSIEREKEDSLLAHEKLHEKLHEKGKLISRV